MRPWSHWRTHVSLVFFSGKQDAVTQAAWLTWRCECGEYRGQQTTSVWVCVLPLPPTWRSSFIKNLLHVPKGESWCTSAFLSFAFSMKKETPQRKIKHTSGLLLQKPYERCSLVQLSRWQREQKSVSEPGWCCDPENREVNLLTINWSKEFSSLWFSNSSTPEKFWLWERTQDLGQWRKSHWETSHLTGLGEKSWSREVCALTSMRSEEFRSQGHPLFILEEDWAWGVGRKTELGVWERFLLVCKMSHLGDAGQENRNK